MTTLAQMETDVLFNCGLTRDQSDYRQNARHHILQSLVQLISGTGAAYNIPQGFPGWPWLVREFRFTVPANTDRIEVMDIFQQSQTFANLVKTDTMKAERVAGPIFIDEQRVRPLQDSTTINSSEFFDATMKEVADPRYFRYEVDLQAPVIYFDTIVPAGTVMLLNIRIGLQAIDSALWTDSTNPFEGLLDLIRPQHRPVIVFAASYYMLLARDDRQKAQQYLRQSQTLSYRMITEIRSQKVVKSRHRMRLVGSRGFNFDNVRWGEPYSGDRPTAQDVYGPEYTDEYS